MPRMSHINFILHQVIFIFRLSFNSAAHSLCWFCFSPHVGRGHPGIPKLINQLLISICLLNNIQNLPAGCFLSGKLQPAFIPHLFDYYRNPAKPCFLRCRQRRSPAMSSNPSLTFLTRSGCRMPFSRIEPASSSIFSWSKLLRGCKGLALFHRGRPGAILRLAASFSGKLE